MYQYPFIVFNFRQIQKQSEDVCTSLGWLKSGPGTASEGEVTRKCSRIL